MRAYHRLLKKLRAIPPAQSKIAGIVASAQTCRTWLSGDSPNLARAEAALERIIRDGNAAADIIRIKPRQMRRIRRAIERGGLWAVMDQRGGRPRRKRIAVETMRELCRLKREVAPTFRCGIFTSD